MNSKARNNLINLILLLISPMLSLVFNGIKVFKNELNRGDIKYISLSSALIIAYLPPLFDNINYFWFFEVISTFKFTSFINSPGVDVIYYLPYYFAKKIGVSFRAVTLLYYFFIFYFWILSYYKIKIKSNISKYNSLFLFFYFLSFSYRDVGDLTRFLIATSIFTYLTIKILVDSKKLKYYQLFLFLLPISLHFSYFLPVAILIASLLFKKKFKISATYFTVSLTLGMFIVQISELVIKLLPIGGELKGKIIRYFIERKYQTSVFSRGITGFFVILAIISCILSVFYLKRFIYKNISKEIKNYYNFVGLFSIILAAMYFDRVFFERNGVLFRMIFLNMIFLNYKLSKKIYGKTILIIILSLFSLKVMGENIRYLKWSLSSEYPLITNQEEKLKVFNRVFYMPGFMLLDIKKNSYNDDWHRQNTSYRDFRYFERYNK